jgi:hypothetical protein
MQMRTYKKRIALFNELIKEADTTDKIQFVTDAIAKLNNAFTIDYSAKQAQITKLQNELKEFSEPLITAISALERKLSKKQADSK